MNYRWKRVAAAVCAATLSVGMLAGCGSSKSKAIENANEVLFTYDGEDVTLKEAYIYAKMTAANYDQSYGYYFGTDFWTMEVEEGVTMEDSAKEAVIEQIKQIIVLDHKAEENDISLTDDEIEDCESYAKAFAKEDQGKEILKAAGADESDMQKIYEDNALASKMQEEAIKDTDTEVSDDEARHTTISRVVFATTTTDDDGNTVDMTDDEKAAVKKTAEEALKKLQDGTSIDDIAEEQEYTDTSETYGAGESEEGEDFEEAMAKVSDGDILNKVMECDNGYVIAQMVAYTDEDATSEAKEEIIEQRQQDKFSEVYEEWTKDLEEEWDYETSVDQTLWAEVILRSEDSTATDSQEETTAAESDTSAESETSAE